jgi:hypothetical protein
MLDDVKFEVTRQTPILDHYRREWVPARDAELAGIWVGAVVSDDSGNKYWGLRGFDDFVTGMTHVVSPICGFRELPAGMDTEAPHLFAEYAGIDWYEPLQYIATVDYVQMLYSSGRIVRDAKGLHWYDASDRWQLHGRAVSDIVLTHVPSQPGIDQEVYYRHELLYVTGTINGVDVSGYAHQDFAYGPPGQCYAQLPIVRQLQGMWVSWLDEYPDGEIGGGSLWQGKDGLDFGPGYQVNNGSTTVHDDIVATPTFDSAERMTQLDATIGSRTYSFTLDTVGSPLHVFGHLADSSVSKHPARSWVWVEYAGGLLSAELLDMAMLPFALARGK